MGGEGNEDEERMAVLADSPDSSTFLDTHVGAPVVGGLGHRLQRWGEGFGFLGLVQVVTTAVVC